MKDPSPRLSIHPIFQSNKALLLLQIYSGMLITKSGRLILNAPFFRFNETLEVVNSGLGLDYSVNSYHKKIKNAFLSQVRLNEST